MFQGKPIIGIAGGIGAGKSYIAAIFGTLGCLVIDADASVRAAYADPAVRATLRSWWGDSVLFPDGSVDRKSVARRVFSDPDELHRLESLLHPIVRDDRETRMKAAANDPAVVAYVWDIPLLFETRLDSHCDAIVFVDCPLEDRLARVAATRGWSADELTRRENYQYPLDKKRSASHYVLRNTANALTASAQVRDLLSQILAGS